jgi:limonene-1,2-epoxide hydrolase
MSNPEVSPKELKGLELEADTVVRELAAAWERNDADALVGMFAGDAVYHNVPMPALHGTAAIREFIEGFLKMMTSIQFEVHQQLVSGGVVMNERTDTIVFKNGKRVELPVCGVYEVKGGRIQSWSDYADLAQFVGAMSD